METNKSVYPTENKNPELLGVPHNADAEAVSAWELVDTGRYRPRRIRGSFRGRELG